MAFSSPFSHLRSHISVLTSHISHLTSPFSHLQNFHCYCSASLGVGQSMMVVFQVEPTGLRHSVQLMIRQGSAVKPSRCPTSAIESIVRPIHPIYTHYSPQAALVERRVVRHQRQPLYQRFDALPHTRKNLGIVRIFVSQAMHTLTEPFVVVRLRTYQAVERVHNLSIPHHHNPHTANTRRTLVCRLKINSSKIIHIQNISKSYKTAIP